MYVSIYLHLYMCVYIYKFYIKQIHRDFKKLTHDCGSWQVGDQENS